MKHGCGLRDIAHNSYLGTDLPAKSQVIKNRQKCWAWIKLRWEKLFENLQLDVTRSYATHYMKH